VGIAQTASREGNHCPPVGGYRCHFLCDPSRSSEGAAWTGVGVDAGATFSV